VLPLNLALVINHFTRNLLFAMGSEVRTLREIDFLLKQLADLFECLAFALTYF